MIFRIFIRKYLKNKYIAFVFSFICLFIMFLSINNTYFPHDSSGYWNMSYAFRGDNILITLNPTSFTMIDWNNTLFSIRGFVFPLFLYVFRGGPINSMIIFWLSWSLFFSYSYVYALPDIFEVISKKSFNIFQRIIPFFLLVLMFPGLFIYPLTDAFSLGFSVIILKLALYLRNNKFLKVFPILLYSFILGLFLYILYNIRFVYIYNCFFFIILFLFWNRYRKKYLLLLCIIMLFFGIIFSAIPQIIINQHYFHKSIPTSPIHTSQSFTNFLTSGFYWDRFESQAVDLALLSSNSISRAITKKQEINIFSINSFIKTLLNYPLEVLGVYSSHFINLIDARYGEIYVKDFAVTWLKTLKIVFMHTLWFIGFFCASIHLCKSKIKKKIFNNNELNNFVLFLKKYGSVVFYLGFTSLTATLTHVEPRYMIGLYVLLFVLLSFFCPYRSIIKKIKNHPLSIIFLYIFTLGVCSAIWNWTFSVIDSSERFLK